MVAAKIPSLELIQIASPCTADWDAMVGDDRARHCGDCKLNVYNLSDMTREEALDFLNKREGRTCIRMFKRADGTVLTRDCPVGLRAVRAKFVRLILATAGLMLAVAFTALAALGKVPGARAYLLQGKLDRLREAYAPQLIQRTMVMGGICAPPPTPIPPPNTALSVPPVLTLPEDTSAPPQ